MLRVSAQDDTQLEILPPFGDRRSWLSEPLSRNDMQIGCQCEELRPFAKRRVGDEVERSEIPRRRSRVAGQRGNLRPNIRLPRPSLRSVLVITGAQ